ncbi:uncharacterized protein Dwil_GK19321 [Drosophila willistoni]|uniref:Uncharacterized protein n=2 Tax=Drosophila willistoni TaxID=7260 RepID=B4MK57_DROWI|nr:uncharacterized protein Dwil_GK19321 [Drosophila willistoni]
MAGKKWNSMNMVEKAPFLNAARRANYVFKLKNNPDANMVLDKLRGSVAGGKLDLQILWVLIEAIQSWRESVLRDLNRDKGKNFN